MLRKIVILIIILFKLSEFSFVAAQNDTLYLSMDDCIYLANTENFSIRIADAKHKMATSIKSSARTKHFGNIDFVGRYQFTNKQMQLLGDNLFIPVVPFWAIDQETMDLSPNIEDNPLFHGIVTNPFTGEVYTDPEGNPLFFMYSYLPSDHIDFGQSHNFVFGPSFNQPIYMGGKIRSLISMTEATENIAEANKNIKTNEVHFEIQEAYWLLVDLQEKNKLVDKYIKFLDNLIYDLENLHQEGIITYHDVLNAKLQLNKVNLKKTKINSGIDLASMYLCHLVGLPTDSNIVLTEDLDNIPVLPNPSNIADIAIQNRDEIKMLESTRQLAISQHEISKARFLPNISLSANYLFMNPNPYAGFKNEFGSDFTFGINVHIPIFYWGERRHTLNATEKLISIADLKKQEAESLISMEVQKAWHDYKQAVEIFSINNKALELADKNLNLQRDKYNEGMITSSFLIEAKAKRHEAYSNLIEAKTNLKLIEVEYNKKLGILNK